MEFLSDLRTWGGTLTRIAFVPCFVLGLLSCRVGPEPAPRFDAQFETDQSAARRRLRQFVAEQVEPWLFTGPGSLEDWGHDLRSDLYSGRRLFNSSLEWMLFDLPSLSRACENRALKTSDNGALNRFLQFYLSPPVAQPTSLFYPDSDDLYYRAEKIIPALNQDLTRARGFLAQVLLVLQERLERDLPAELRAGLQSLALVDEAVLQAAQVLDEPEVSIRNALFQKSLTQWFLAIFDVMDEFQKENLLDLGRLLDLSTRYGDAPFLKPKYLGDLQNQIGGVGFALDWGVEWGKSVFDRIQKKEISNENRSQWEIWVTQDLQVREHDLLAVIAAHSTPEGWCERGLPQYLSSKPVGVRPEVQQAFESLRLRALGHLSTLSWLRYLQARSP